MRHAHLLHFERRNKLFRSNHFPPEKPLQPDSPLIGLLLRRVSIGLFRVRTLLSVACQVFLLLSASTAFANEDYRLNYFQTDQRYTYRIALLNLAMQKTEEQFGSYQLIPRQESITQARGEALLASGLGVDIAFLPTSVEREEKMLAVRIPMLRGILGYRVMLIHQSTQQAFLEVTHIDILRRKFIGGFGAQWADMVILEANGLNVVGVTKYDSLFSMLDRKRFHYFPRGINEAWKELEERKALFPHLAVEQSLALYYPYPVYFFCNRNRPEIARRIRIGLETALDDGSFQVLFLDYHGSLVKQANLHQRRLFVLTNPNLPKGTESPDTSWWLQ